MHRAHQQLSEGVQGAAFCFLAQLSIRICMIFFFFNEKLSSFQASGLHDDVEVQLKGFIDCKVTDVLRQA